MSFYIHFYLFVVCVVLAKQKIEESFLDINNPVVSFEKDLRMEISPIKLDQIFNVKCFWIKGLNVFDISSLEQENQDFNFTTNDGTVYYNFCRNINYKCLNTTTPVQMIGRDKSSEKCYEYAGNADNMSKFSLLNETDPYAGLQIELTPGAQCGEEKYSIIYKILCDEQMNKGEIIFNNTQDFSIKNCKNLLIGKSKAACPFLNYYIVQYFFTKYSTLFGAVIIIIGLFLLLFGAKFIKITVFVVSTLSCITVSLIIFFNIFTFNSTTTVWVVLCVSFILGITLGYFLINLTKLFFMVLGGYLGYTIGIFLYNVVLNYIHADPKVIYWVTLIACIAIFSILALWIVKQLLIFSTSICGAYGIIRGASLYIGNFPSESVVLDLIQHQEWDQLEKEFNGKVYIYLSIWLVLALSGIFFQYKINIDKRDDDYIKLKN